AAAVTQRQAKLSGVFISEFSRVEEEKPAIQPHRLAHHPPLFVSRLHQISAAGTPKGSDEIAVGGTHGRHLAFATDPGGVKSNRTGTIRHSRPDPGGVE